MPEPKSRSLLAFARKFWGLSASFIVRTLLYFAIFSVVSPRGRRAFRSSRPSAVLAAAWSFDAAAGLLIGRIGLAALHPLPAEATAATLACTSFCAPVANDAVKVPPARAPSIARGAAV